jgi:VWFA-related protein
MTRLIVRTAVIGALVFIPAGPRPVQGQQATAPPQTQAQQRPVFRGGTHFVRVDAYPVRDGKIVENLEAGDFEILEDGRPQQVESLDFVRFDTFTPEAERIEPRTQREGFDMAADPRNRVFVIFVDLAFSQSAGAFTPTNSIKHIEQPLAQFLDRILTPHDLFGFMTSRNSAKDLVLQRKTAVTKDQIAEAWRASFIGIDEADNLSRCDCGNVVGEACLAMLERLKARYRAEGTYTALESLVDQLGSIREERKSIILVTDLLPRFRPDQTILTTRGPKLPRTGINNGRLGTHENAPIAGDATYCASEFQRLANLDLDPRYKELLRQARRQNVSFYPITPGGLQAPVSLPAILAQERATDDFRTLAQETDGIAIVNTNDLKGGINRIGDDLAAYYVLGYYTTNTKWDGGIRKIQVKDKTGKVIRARREYRAPTPEEIAALAAPKPARSGGRAGEAKQAALLGEPAIFVNNQSVRTLTCSRTDRVRIEFTPPSPLEGKVARLLDARGQPMPVPVNVSDDETRTPRRLIVTLSLAPLARGTYQIELNATAAGATERRLVPLQVQ